MGSNQKYKKLMNKKTSSSRQTNIRYQTKFTLVRKGCKSSVGESRKNFKTFSRGTRNSGIRTFRHTTITNFKRCKKFIFKKSLKKTLFSTLMDKIFKSLK